MKGVQHGEGEVIETDGNMRRGRFRQNVAVVEKGIGDGMGTGREMGNESGELKGFRTRLSTSANKNRTLVLSN